MREKTLLVIDSYLSNEERVEACRNLISQLRLVFGDDYEILLINKSSNDFGLQNKVEYYYNLSNSFLVGYPPEDILDSQKYERPYVYVDTGGGICENWLPLTGITDHVAGIYNSFIIASEVSKLTGHTHVFKVEYDTIFDLNELKDIRKDLEKNPDFIFYGSRKMGEYAKDHHYLIDVHIIAYKNSLFDGFQVVKNDEDFWKLNERINYYGKWIEYIIPSIFEYQKRNIEYHGIDYSGHLGEKYPLSKFDIINGEGGWTEKWKNIPKVCSIKGGNQEEEFVLFYWNDKQEPLEVDAEIKDSDGNSVYKRSVSLNPNTYVFDTLPFSESEMVMTNRNKIGNITENYTNRITKDEVINSNLTFKFKNN